MFYCHQVSWDMCAFWNSDLLSLIKCSGFETGVCGVDSSRIQCPPPVVVVTWCALCKSPVQPSGDQAEYLLAFILFWLSLRCQLHYVSLGYFIMLMSSKIVGFLGEKLKKIRVLYITSLFLYAYQSSLSWDDVTKVVYSHDSVFLR